MGQNRYRLFKQNEGMKIEQDIETLHNPISCPIYINIISIFVLYDLNKYVDFGLNLN